jgi:hypothetical protein
VNRSSVFALFILAVLAAFVATDHVRADIGSTSRKMKGSFVVSSGTTAANETTIVRWPAPGATSDALVDTLADGSRASATVSVGWLRYRAREACSLKVFSRSIPGGSSGFEASSGGIGPAPHEGVISGIGQGIDSLMIIEISGGAPALDWEIWGFR